MKTCGVLLFSMFLLVTPLGSVLCFSQDKPEVMILRPDQISIVKNGYAMERDPFNWPPAHIDEMIVQEHALESEKIFSDLTLKGILWDEARPMAIINDRTVGAGDSVGKAVVEYISKDEVVLRHNSLKYVLQFKTLNKVIVIESGKN